MSYTSLRETSRLGFRLGTVSDWMPRSFVESTILKAGENWLGRPLITVKVISRISRFFYCIGSGRDLWRKLSINPADNNSKDELEINPHFFLANEISVSLQLTLRFSSPNFLLGAAPSVSLISSPRQPAEKRKRTRGTKRGTKRATRERKRGGREEEEGGGEEASPNRSAVFLID